MKVQHLRQVQLPPGQVELTLGAARVGRTPELGVALPYTDPPEAVHPLLRELGLRAATYYSFVDVLPEQPGREIGYRRLYAEEFGLRTSVTLLAGTGRRAVLAADRSEEHTSELQSRPHLVCRLLLEKKKIMRLVLLLILHLLILLTPHLRMKKILLKVNWTFRKRLWRY